MVNVSEHIFEKCLKRTVQYLFVKYQSEETIDKNKELLKGGKGK